MTIDAHQHFWHYDPVKDAWIDETMTAIRRDFLPADLEPVLAANGIEGCIAVQASQSLAETEFLLDLADRHDFIRGVVGWVDLRAPEVSDQLARFADHPKFVGVRHVVQAEAEGFMLDPHFQRGIAALREFNLTYDILILQHQLGEAGELARTFPDQPFVLDHLAKPQVSHGLDPDWATGIARLAECPNVHGKLSGLVTETTDWEWTVDDFRPFIDHALDVFGPDRLLFGSDWPVCRLAANYGQVRKIVETAVAELPEAERLAIMGSNARRFYGC
ncbi:amidohydrolase [Lewinella sp. JB7]|uniref:amidohydrolase family protein n=1 Tax=Lewinella sp. JB7 TaxID=2962887 RepID=UPI0020C96343|nr:amidohydrolase family protein [Lewinella sp. JB7]MCP9235854.1 amidohydrolase family protein [Lewinella sp. JB7]